MTKRTTSQNSKLWPLLEEISEQAMLDGQKYDPSEWKLIFLSALSRTKKLEANIIRGILGEPINLGRSSSKLEKELFSELIELIYHFGAENGVKFKEDK